VIDPMAERHHDFSPYSYVLNNPIFYIDPDGNREWPGAGLIYANVAGQVDNKTVRQVQVSQGKQALAGMTFVAGFTPVDAALDAGSLVKNVATGNWGGAGLDGLALVGLDFIKDGKQVSNVAAASKKVNKNSNEAVSNFALYEVKDGDELLKVGKADANRTTASGDPVRMKASENEAKKAGYMNARANVVENLGETTTKKAKEAEAARVRDKRAEGNTLPLNKERDKMYHNK
jgi:ketosteroid isomerase-like protein